MKTRFLISIGIMSVIAIIFASIYYSDFQQREYINELREEQQCSAVKEASKTL